MFKIALNAGHFLGTPGKRCLQSIDQNETREWTLNSRICDKIEQKLNAYEGYELLRIDDRTGENDISIAERAKKANDFGADIYIAIHHNAGIGGGDGGGVMAYTYITVDQYTKNMQQLLYNKVVEKTGLSGNRSSPLAAADLGECRMTRMPAVLLECGFMDSTTDTPIILTDDFASGVAAGVTEGIAELGSLSLKPSAPDIIPDAPSDTLYRVQVGAYKEKANAEAMAQKLKDQGYNVIIK